MNVMKRRRRGTTRQADFHTTLLWVRAVEIAGGHDPTTVMSELEAEGLFTTYRPPWRA